MRIAVLANRESVVADVKSAFPGEECCVSMVMMDMAEYVAVARRFVEELNRATAMGESVRIVLACPIAVAYLIGGALHHSTRKIVLSVLNLSTKRYEDLDVSDHLASHV